MSANGPAEIGVGFWSMQSTYMRPIRPAAVYEEARQEAQLVESLGFDTFWMGEHHVSYDGYCPSLFPAAGSILAATESLRVSTGILVLPFHPAERVAEGCAALSSAAPDRFRLAVGTGYRPIEFEAGGVDLADRAELMDSRLRDLRGPLRERAGVDDIWVGTAAKVGINRAAKYGCSVLLQPTVTSRRIPDLRDQWESGLQQVPGGPAPRFGIMRETWVDTDPKMVDWARGRLKEMWRHYSIFWVDDPVEEREKRDLLAEQTAGQALFGSPDEVVERLGRLLEAGADTIALRVRFDGVTGTALNRCLELLVTEVLPQLGWKR
jgi:alkanesulfonate monooxygenase SsuD/methylene tetrahydromethanopterin reductase-like flavin-dependent oxidoreductase (luciferase family)